MSYLRFTPADYRALRQACDLFSPLHFRPRALQRVLIASLRETQPDLAANIGRLRIGQLSVLCEHLRPCRAKGRPELSPHEVGALAAEFGPLLLSVRFSRPLKRALVRQLLLESPSLAAKLHHLSQDQFREVCEQIRDCIGRGP